MSARELRQRRVDRGEESKEGGGGGGREIERLGAGRRGEQLTGAYAPTPSTFRQMQARITDALVA
jgi:hypothetical protein